MLEIINCIILQSYASFSLRQPPQRKPSEKSRDYRQTVEKMTENFFPEGIL